MKQVLLLLFMAVIHGNNSSSKTTQNVNMPDTIQTKITQSNVEDTIPKESADKQAFITSCMVNAKMGQGLITPQKKLFCACLWDKTKGDAKLIERENKGCMEKAQKARNPQ